MKVKMCLALAWIAVSGCVRAGNKTGAIPYEPQDVYQQFVGGIPLSEKPADRPSYRLNCGDTIEICYEVKNEVSSDPYKLKVEDVVNVEFPYQPQYDQERTVGGDGNIRVKLVGEVRAAGQTANELEAQLRSGYARYIKDPEITVAVKAGDVKLAELKKAITIAPRGQSRVVPIKPDGTIDLPYVGEVPVAGKTVKETKQLLDQLYAENDLKEIEVTVRMQEFAPLRIYVMGEVATPGMIEMQGPISLMQALARQGGPNRRADRSKILLVRRQNLPVPEAVIFDMDSIMAAKTTAANGNAPDGSPFQYDLYLSDGDFVYVPASRMARATDWIHLAFTRGIR